MDSFQNRLKIALNDSSLSQAEVARRINSSRSTISGWLKGEYEPNSENIYKLARLFNVSEAWLLGFDDEKNRISTLEVEPRMESILMVPLLNASAGKAESDFSQTNEIVEAPSNLSHYKKSNLFAVRVCGDSMNKILPAGSIAICVKPIDNPQSGDIVVYRQDSEIAIKRYIRTEQIILFEPVSFDDGFKTMVFDANEDDIEVEILGIVKHNFTNFE